MKSRLDRQYCYKAWVNVTGKSKPKLVSGSILRVVDQSITKRRRFENCSFYISWSFPSNPSAIENRENFVTCSIFKAMALVVISPLAFDSENWCSYYCLVMCVMLLWCNCIFKALWNSHYVINGPLQPRLSKIFCPTTMLDNKYVVIRKLAISILLCHSCLRGKFWVVHPAISR